MSRRRRRILSDSSSTGRTDRAIETRRRPRRVGCRRCRLRSVPPRVPMRRGDATRIRSRCRCATRSTASSRSRGGSVEREQQVDVEAQERPGQLGMADEASRGSCPHQRGCGAPRASCRRAPGRRRRPTGPPAAGAPAQAVSSRSRESGSHISPIGFHLSAQMVNARGQMRRSQRCPPGCNGAARGPWAGFRTLILVLMRR